MRIYNTETVISSSRPNSTSGRTSVPRRIMELLELKVGGTMKWYVDVEGNELKVSVVKGKDPDSHKP